MLEAVYQCLKGRCSLTSWRNRVAMRYTIFRRRLQERLIVPQASQSIPSLIFDLFFSLLDDFVAGNNARSVRAMSPLPGDFFIFTQLYAQDLPRRIRTARRGSLDYAFLISRFHLPPPHALSPRDYR